MNVFMYSCNTGQSEMGINAPLTPETQRCSPTPNPGGLEALGFTNINGDGVPAKIQERHFSEERGVSPKR
jgi:hypothetical protein